MRHFGSYLKINPYKFDPKRGLWKSEVIGDPPNLPNGSFGLDTQMYMLDSCTVVKALSVNKLNNLLRLYVKLMFTCCLIKVNINFKVDNESDLLMGIRLAVSSNGLEETQCHVLSIQI